MNNNPLHQSSPSSAAIVWAAIYLKCLLWPNANHTSYPSSTLAVAMASTSLLVVCNIIFLHTMFLSTSTTQHHTMVSFFLCGRLNCRDIYCADLYYCFSLCGDKYVPLRRLSRFNDSIIEARNLRSSVFFFESTRKDSSSSEVYEFSPIRANDLQYHYTLLYVPWSCLMSPILTNRANNFYCIILECLDSRGYILGIQCINKDCSIKSFASMYFRCWCSLAPSAPSLK